jgi:predicted permease
MKPIVITLLIAALFSLQTLGKTKDDEKTVSNTTVSLFSNINFNGYNFTDKQGEISTQSNSNDWGIGICKDYYIAQNNFFLSVGIQYYATSSTINVGTIVWGFDANSFHKYVVTYDQLAVPLHIGKTYRLLSDKSLHVDPYIGFSLGLSGFGSTSQEMSLQHTDNNNDYLATNPSISRGLSGYIFHSSFDVGFRIAPIDYPNLNLGCMFSTDLTKSPSFGDNGYFLNESRMLHENYIFSFTRKFTNIQIQLNYTFGKRWKNHLLNDKKSLFH